MTTFRRVAVLSATAALFAACAKSEPAKDTTVVATPAAAPAPPPAKAIAAADVAGKWQFRTVPESGTDTTSTNYVLTATADTAGWFITFANGLKVPQSVTLSGDSIIEKSGVYSSVRRKGVKVTTNTVLHMVGGKLIGNTVAHYATTGPDSVLRLKGEGTKMP